MTDDDRCMIRLQSGETSAFDEIVERYRSRLVGFFIRNVRDPQLAEDLAQETLLKVFNQAWDYLPLGRFRGWLFRIAHNLMIDDIRRRSHDALLHASTGKNREDHDALSRLAAGFAPPQQNLHAEEFIQLVDQLLMEIPEEQRTAFTMHHYSGIPLAEVAIAMECSEATAKSRLRLAREKLAEKLRVRGITASQTRESSV